MKTAQLGFCALLFLLGLATAPAAIAPGHGKRMQEKAGEALKIKVLSIEVKKTISPKGRTEKVEIEAEVLEATRSKQGLKKGDKIAISYERFFATLPQPGPQQPPILEKEKEYPAFLDYDEDLKKYKPSAWGYSFEEIKIGG